MIGTTLGCKFFIFTLSDDLDVGDELDGFGSSTSLPELELDDADEEEEELEPFFGAWLEMKFVLSLQ